MQGTKAPLFVVVLTSFLFGCTTHQLISSSQAKAGEFHRIEGEGVENLYDLGNRLYSGSSPEGDEGFKTLQKLGIKTIISVDGSAPEADRARKFGMRYVHLPIGYDGTSRSNALRIVKAAEIMPGPVFVHCHHGQHRGPVAAALICEGLHGWSGEQAETWLREAGTATNYPGLYRTVREFKTPTESELGGVPKAFTSRARTPDLVNTMVQIDGHFDALKAMQKAGFKSVSEHPDATPETESLLLCELFKEAHRNKQGSERGEPFVAELAKAEASAEILHTSLKNIEAHRAENLTAAESAFQNMTKTCASCHKAFRN